MIASFERERLHLGCGNDVLPGWVNHDLAALPGVDVVHDLDSYPWPFEDDRFDEVRLHHVLEHLSEPVRAIEELHRITRDGGAVEVRVPYWNSTDWATDPTHKTPFSEYSFDFFDPATRHGRERPVLLDRPVHDPVEDVLDEAGRDLHPRAERDRAKGALGASRATSGA